MINFCTPQLVFVTFLSEKQCIVKCVTMKLSGNQKGVTRSFGYYITADKSKFINNFL